MLLAAYGVFLCSYFIFQDYSDPYRFFARVVFVLGIFVFYTGIKSVWRHPLFLAIAGYMAYLLISGFWSDAFHWFLWGQKFTISIYILNFIAVTHYLVNWNRGHFERMLLVCVIFAALTALLSLEAFYQEKTLASTRLDGIGALTNVNIFSNVYGIFALLAMGFVLRAERFPYKALFLLAVGIFISFAWFGQSRTAFVSLLIALSALAVLTLKKRRVLYLSILATLAGALFLLFPEVAEHALLRGHGLRPMIWEQAWEEVKTAPFIGHGLISVISVRSGQIVFETIHNAYLQVLWHGGVIGLCLFLLVLIMAFRNAWIWGTQQRDYTVFCMLIFTACVMMTGVDTLIARPRDQWMLFWLPVALLLATAGGGTDKLTSPDQRDLAPDLKQPPCSTH